MTLKQFRGIRENLSLLTVPRVKEWEGVVGNGAGTGTVYVPGTNDDLIYVCPVGLKIPVKVRAGAAPAVEGMRVWIGKDFGNRRTLRVQGVTSTTSGASVQPHGITNHMWGGSDPVYIDTVQIVNTLVYAALTDMIIKINPGWVTIAGKHVRIAQLTSIDMTSHIPATGALYSLVRVNSSGAISIQEGTPAATYLDLAAADIPEVAVGYALLGFVRTYEGQTKLSRLYANPDVIDVRFVARAEMMVGEADGSPLGHFTEIKFPSGSLTNNGDGTVSVDLSAAAGDSSFSAAYSGRPAVSNDGDLFLPSDGMNIERDSGAAWVPWGPIWPWTKPVIGDFGWVNQGGASATDERGALTLYDPAAANTNPNYRILQKAAPSTPYTITACFWSNFMRINYFNVGIGWRQSSDGKLVLLRAVFNTVDKITVTKCSGETADVADYSTIDQLIRNPVFLRITDTGTNRISYLSYDGYNWLTLHTIGRTDYLTPDQVLFFFSSRNASWPNYSTLLHWKQT
jgi:hypothetical protein